MYPEALVQCSQPSSQESHKAGHSVIHSSPQQFPEIGDFQLWRLAMNDTERDVALAGLMSVKCSDRCSDGRTGTYCGMYKLTFSLLMPLKIPE